MLPPLACPHCGALLNPGPGASLAATCPSCGKPWAERVAAEPANDTEVVVFADGPAAIEAALVEAKRPEEPLVIDEPSVEVQLAPEPEPVFLEVGPVEELGAQARKLPEGSWFLETPEGLRFGPVSREELAQWVAEGRVSLDCRLKRSPDLDLAPGDYFPGLNVPPRRAHPQRGVGAAVSAPPKLAPERKPAESPVPKPGEVPWPVAHRGYWILLLGICSWAACPILGVTAWMMGNHDLHEMQAGRMDSAGEPDTTLGSWLGMGHAIVSGIVLLIGLVASGVALLMR